MNADQIVTLLGAGGGGAFLVALINGIIKWLSGASAREQQKNTDLVTQRHDAVKSRIEAEQERDDEADKRREAEEHVSILKRQLLENGIMPRERAKHRSELG